LSHQLLRNLLVHNFVHRQGDDDFVAANGVNPSARIFKGTANDSPSPWRDLSRLGNGERNLANPKSANAEKVDEPKAISDNS